MGERVEGECLVCHQPGHRYGTSDPHHDYDAMACVNMLLPEIERLRKLLAHKSSGMRVEPQPFICPMCGWDERSKLSFLRHVITKHGHLIPVEAGEPTKREEG